MSRSNCTMKSFVSRSSRVLGLIALLLGGGGCLTCNVLHGAKEQSHRNSGAEVVVDQKAQPARYALLPLTIPVDIVTSPIQAISYMWASKEGD